ncbi:hypothetical protein FKM82_010553 [Ascaphus truei]
MGISVFMVNALISMCARTALTGFQAYQECIQKNLLHHTNINNACRNRKLHLGPSDARGNGKVSWLNVGDRHIFKGFINRSLKTFFNMLPRHPNSLDKWSSHWYSKPFNGAPRNPSNFTLLNTTAFSYVVYI